MSKVKLNAALKARMPFVWLGTNDQQRFLRMAYKYSNNTDTDLYIWDKCNGLKGVNRYEKFTLMTYDMNDFGSEFAILHEIRRKYIEAINSWNDLNSNDKIYVIKNPDMEELKKGLSLMIDFAELFDANGKAPFTYKIIILTQATDINQLPTIINAHTISAKIDPLTKQEAGDVLHWFCDDKGVSFSSDSKFDEVASLLVDTFEVYARRILELAFALYGEVNEESVKLARKSLA